MDISQRRIQGCGSNFRSSFSSSFIGGGGGSSFTLGSDEENTSPDSLLPITSRRLNSSVISYRQSFDPILGLEALDGDGEEELAKVDLLARAAYGLLTLTPPPPTDVTLSTSKMFRMLHAVITLGCAPEIVWYAAARYPHQVEEKDEFGKCPLFLACDRLAMCTRRLANRRLSVAEGMLEGTNEIEIVAVDVDGDPDTKFVKSLLLGGEHPCMLKEEVGTATYEPPRSQRRTLPPQHAIPQARLLQKLEIVHSQHAPNLDRCHPQKQ